MVALKDNMKSSDDKLKDEAQLEIWFAQIRN